MVLDKKTVVHWHGFLLPWRMDGVANVTQRPTPPGEMYSYHFNLRQASK